MRRKMQPMHIETSSDDFDHKKEEHEKKEKQFHRIIIFIVIGLLLILIPSYHYSTYKNSIPSSMEHQQQQQQQQQSESLETIGGDDDGDTNNLMITSDSISIIDTEMLHYLRCVAHTDAKIINTDNRYVDILMLHGAAFTAEDWRSSGILQKLCYGDGRSNGIHIRSVTALDLPVSADGVKLVEVFDRLQEESLISDNHGAIVITPSASGRAVVTMAEMATANSRYVNYLNKIFRGWIPVACPAIKSATEQALNKFTELSIPVMAVYGSKDSMGATVSDKLVSYAGATKHEIYGSHPCYLDSPDAFVDLVRNFLRETKR